MDLKTKLETTTKNHQASIQNLEAKFDRFADKLSGRPSGSLPSNTQPNPKGSSSKPYQPPQALNEQVNAVFTRSGKSYDPPINLNDQPNDFETPVNFDSNDEDEESTPQPKPKDPKPVKETLIPKPYKPKIPYPQRLKKENMEAQYELVSNKHKLEQISVAFLSDESSALIQNKFPPKLGDPKSFLISCNFNKSFLCDALADLGASINLMPYSLYAKLSLETLNPTKMSVRLADRSFQYPVGIAENMLVKVFVILKMEEDSKVPLILGNPFLHTADAVIRVKQKQLNIGVGTERNPRGRFRCCSAMKHSYSNDDTCFSIDVINKILEEDFDVVLDEGSKILYSNEGTILEDKLFAEFDEFMAMTTEENFESKSNTEELPFKKITFNTDYKIKTSLEEPHTDPELKHLLDNLEYAFWEEPSFLSVIISSQLSEEKKTNSFPRNWNFPFELMCDASEFAVRAVLEFDIEIKDKKGAENVVADHLSRIENDETNDDNEVDEVHPLVRLYEACQKTRNISKRDEMPLNSIQVCKIFDIWGIDFMGAFSKSYNSEYILVAVDYVSKWAEAQALPTNDARVVISFLKKLFCRFGIPKALISDRDTHFCNKIMEKIMKRYRVNHHFSTPYHPQMSGQVKNTNRALKRILEKIMKDNPAIWSRKLDDALWAFRTAYKTPTEITPYKLVYRKNYHLPFEIKHRAYWALKNCNPNLIAAGEKRMFQLHELDEFRHPAYENSRLYKARTKVWHDRKLKIRKEFKHRNKVLLFHSKYKFKQPKLKSRRLGSYVVKHQYPSEYVELYGKDGKAFIVNGHRLKLYHEEDNYLREGLSPFFPKE
ncbi:reverse transcriptase domain-containing protein [Tanacetum coccineum]